MTRRKLNIRHAAALAAFLFQAAAAVPGQTATQPSPQVSTLPQQPVPPPGPGPGLTSADLFHLRSASDPHLSPDGRSVLFTVQHADRIGAPYTRIFMLDRRTGVSRPWGSAEGIEGGSPRWSPDGSRVAYRSEDGLVIANADGSQSRPFASVDATNHPLPRASTGFAWSPDGRRIAYVSAVAATEPPMEADPIVITRYWYRPARGWPERFNDNKRLHLFVADVATGEVTQLTQGDNYEHSLDWAPDSRTLLYLANPESDPDRTHNYDIYTIDVVTKAVRRLTETRGVEYAARWSPDGRTIAFLGLMRPVTSSETNMEEPHVWTIDVETGRREEIGAVVDSVQGAPSWSADGRWLYTTVQSRGTVGLYRMPANGGAAERVGPADSARGSVGSFAVAANGEAIAAMATPGDLPQLHLLRPSRAERSAKLTELNAHLLAHKQIAEVESFTFRTYDDREIEAFLTKPIAFDANRKYPMIVVIHGGPHGQQGPAFSAKTQALASRGYASLMVNYRGSTGYGQSFTNLIARDQNGGEAMDILAGVDAALARYSWLDGDRLGVEGGSYGGQLTNWLITQTPRFKAAIPWASISNLVSHNYMSVYHDYLEQEYFGKPHTGGIMDMLWLRSPIRFVDRVRTPVLLSHGDADLLVNVAEIEQFFIALRDVGVEAVMLRYPREGHGMRETQHIADFLDRSLAWYDEHLTAPSPAGAQRQEPPGS